jgi:opacity protein-like surface antigen
MRGTCLISCAAVALLLGCPTANAQGHVSMFVGSNFAGDAGRPLDEGLNDGSRLTLGADLGAMSKGIFGTEFDIAYARHFFGDGPQFGDNYVLTAMPSVIVGVPLGGERGPGVQPYATAGFGLVRRAIDLNGVGSFKDNSLGYSLGFGVNLHAATHFGVRVDYRYFRNVVGASSDNPFGIDFNQGTFNFSRGTVGAIFRF